MIKYNYPDNIHHKMIVCLFSSHLCLLCFLLLMFPLQAELWSVRWRFRDLKQQKPGYKYKCSSNSKCKSALLSCGLQYLLTVRFFQLDFLQVLDFQLSLLRKRGCDGQGHGSLLVPLLQPLLIVMSDFLQLQFCISFHHLMQPLNQKQRARSSRYFVNKHKMQEVLHL